MNVLHKTTIVIALLIVGIVGYLFVGGNLLGQMYDSLPYQTVSGKVASCTYSWLDGSTTIIFSNTGSSVRFVGNYNLEIGTNYTIIYKNMPPRGNVITNLVMEP